MNNKEIEQCERQEIYRITRTLGAVALKVVLNALSPKLETQPKSPVLFSRCSVRYIDPYYRTEFRGSQNLQYSQTNENARTERVFFPGLALIPFAI